MLKYSIKYYLRNISRRKLFSFINISGLAFGITFIILIGQFLYYELSYNRDFKNSDYIYRLADNGSKDFNIDYRIKDQIQGKIPGVKRVSLINKGSIDINVENKSFLINDLIVTDDDFFEMFNLSFLYGNPKDALSTMDKVVLTESTAKNIFGTADVAGKTIRVNHQQDMIITGVVQDLPKHTSFNAEMFVSWLNSINQKLTYKQVCESVTPGDVSKCKYPFNIFVEVEKNSSLNTIVNQIAALNKIDSYRFPAKIKLTPFKTDYFNKEFRDSDLMHGNMELIEILSFIGIIILLLAVINFINLATAAYRYRLTEIGIKKCLGLNRQNLIKQLFLESFFTCLISSLLGIILAELLLPYFNSYIEKSLTLQIFSESGFLFLFITFILVLSLLTGLLPALVLSKISPLQLFKFSPYLKGSGKRYRNALTMLQFSITIILITGLIIINKQIDFVKHKDLGFNTDKLMYLPIHYALGDKAQALSDKLQQYHGIKDVTKTLGKPGTINMTMGGYEAIVIDSSSIRTFGFKIIEGRNLLPGDMNKACLINNTAFKEFGDYSKFKVNGCEVVGVVSDFHTSSLHKKTAPLVLIYNDIWGGSDYLTIRISGPLGNAVNYIKKAWSEIIPDYPLQYGFYDEYFDSMYKKEENFASLISIFSILAVVISCMGIFGLSVFQSEQKLKEVGIRKVFGATVTEIILMLITNFSKWVLLANVIAVPAAYYLLSKWLQNFAYRIEITWWMFALSGIAALLISLLTVIFQAAKAAIANPVDSLKYE